jgi:hypothetical protein
LSHRRDDGFGAVDDAGQIDLRDPLPFGDGQVGDEAGREHAGGVDENVDTTQVGNGFRERLFYGVRLERLGLDIVAASMSRAPRQAILESLSQQIGETCNFGVMAGSHVVYLDRVESAWPFGLRFERGSHVPLHCTSMGKLFLSTLPAPRRALMLRSIPLYRYTENTITDVGRLEEELEKIRSMEVSTDDQEFLAGVVCVAVPVHARRENRSRRWRFRHRWRGCRCNRGWRTFRCCGPPPTAWLPRSSRMKVRAKRGIREPELRGRRRDPENHRQQFLRRSDCRNRRCQTGRAPKHRSRLRRAGGRAPPDQGRQLRLCRAPMRRQRDRQRLGKS